MSYETLLYEAQDGILTLTLNRPDKLNAFTNTMALELIDAFDRSDADDAIRVVIVTGAGRGFCAGADLSAGAATFDHAAQGGATDLDDPSIRDGGGTVTLRIFRSLKPVIAAVNGPAVGIGATMQLAMDIRLASTAARYGFVFARRGLNPEAASSWFLPRAVGINRALEWAVTGRLLSANEALQGGLVSRVVPDAELLETSRSIAHEIARNTSAVSVALIRQMFWRMLGEPHPMRAHQLDSVLIQELSGSRDVHEGIASFRERRAPEFTDRVSADMPPTFPWWAEPPF